MQGHDAHEDALLVGELRKHSERAFRALYDRYRRDIYGYSLALLKSTDLAEENLQEVFLKAWVHRESLDTGKSFKAWLFTIARNQAFNLLNKAANDAVMREQLFHGSQATYETGDFSVRESECKKLRKEAVRQLPPQRRKIFKMARNKGMTYEEISLEMGISVHTVRNQMSKALESMRLYLSAHGELYTIAILTAIEMNHHI